MTDFHHRLRDQLNQYTGGADQVPEDLESFLLAVSQTYHEFDKSQALLEQAMTLSASELSEANMDIQSVLDGLFDVLFLLDSEGQILDCRTRSSHDLFLPGDDLIGKHIQNIPIKEVSKQYEDALRRVKETGRLVSFVYKIPRETQTFFYEARLLPLQTEARFLVVRNITETVEAEIRERKLQAKLAQSERMESLGILAGGVAHDLNNLLGPLVAYPEVILSELGEETSVKEDLEQIRYSAMRAGALIQDLLTLARRGARVRRSLNLSQTVENALSTGELIQLRNKYPHVQVELSLDDGLPPVFASAPHITQCVCNLIMNAYEAIGEDGLVTVTVTQHFLSEPFGHHENFTPGHFLRLCVQDNGEGISEEDANHIFEPFYTKKKMGRSGSGLGLSVVFGVVQDNNGLIEVKSVVGEGCCFNLYLPVASEEDLPELETKLDYGGVERLLIVEDDLEQRKLSERILTRLGYHVVTASHGWEAVEYLKTNTADLVLLDMIMEDDFDGLRTYQEILRLHPGQPCIVVSGFAENEKVREVRRLGAGSFIRKPYSIDEIARAVRSEIDKVPPRKQG